MERAFGANWVKGWASFNIITGDKVKEFSESLERERAFGLK